MNLIIMMAINKIFEYWEQYIYRKPKVAFPGLSHLRGLPDQTKKDSETRDTTKSSGKSQ